jgi:drug/metabolite transporter (DMT)-like permease
MLVALPLLSLQPGDKSANLRGPVWFWLLALFVTNAGGPLAAKLAAEDSRPEAKPYLLALWFAVAAAIAIAALVQQRLRPRPADLPLGVLLGLVNVAGNFALLAALERLPGAVVFPATSAGGLVCVVLTSAALWNERMSRPALVGAALAVPALVLVNLP